MEYWKNKKVLVTGGKGFIGSHLVKKLTEVGAVVTIADINNGYKSCDLTLFKNCLIDTKDKDIVFNLAANVGGISYNNTHQGKMFRENIDIGMNVMEASRQNKVKKFLCVSSACVYSDEAPIPTSELYGFTGNPQETNFGYGWAKRVLELQAQIYAEESKFPVVIVRPYNCYGENDHFGVNGHVIPSLIKKIYNSKKTLEVWGTGEQTRSFIYVEDLVEGMMLAVEKGGVGEVYNLGSKEETTIKDLIKVILDLSCKKIKVKFTNELGGQPRRLPYTYKAEKDLGFIAKTSLREGLWKTLGWYEKS